LTSRVFVYGTLQTDECNYEFIRPYVVSAAPAVTHGWLFDLGVYPAAVEGCGKIFGQLLELDKKHIEQALAVMDQLEGVDPADPSRGLYERIMTTAVTEDGSEVSCYIYRMPEQHKANLIAEASLLVDGVWPLSHRLEQQHMLYAAYGSCMLPESLAEDVQNLALLGPVVIPDYRVAFTRYSNNRRGGVADLLHTPGHMAEGILYWIPVTELGHLDAREGAPYAYRRTTINVQCDGLQLDVMTYEVCQKSKEEFAPHSDYSSLILEGAKLLSAGYRDTLKANIQALQQFSSKGEM
jgi:Uncharacterized conserved protein